MSDDLTARARERAEEIACLSPLAALKESIAFFKDHPAKIINESGSEGDVYTLLMNLWNRLGPPCYGVSDLVTALADDRERLLAEVAELKEAIASKNKILDRISPVLLTIVNWMDGRISDQVLTEALAQKGPSQ